MVPVGSVIGPPGPQIPDVGPIELVYVLLPAPEASTFKTSVAQVVQGASATFCDVVAQLLIDSLVCNQVPTNVTVAAGSLLLLQFSSTIEARHVIVNIFFINRGLSVSRRR